MRKTGACNVYLKNFKCTNVVMKITKTLLQSERHSKNFSVIRHYNIQVLLQVLFGFFRIVKNKIEKGVLKNKVILIFLTLFQSATTCSKLTIETLEQGVKYVLN